MDLVHFIMTDIILQENYEGLGHLRDFFVIS
jgi:hypothetical protein